MKSVASLSYSQRGFQGMCDPLIHINAERKISNESFVRSMTLWSHTIHLVLSEAYLYLL